MGLSEKCIAPLVLGGIIAAGASLAGNAIGSASQIRRIRLVLILIVRIMHLMPNNLKSSVIGRKKCGE